MSTLDLYAEGFPHGSQQGFEDGCRGSACPNHLATEWLTCKEANLLRLGDYGASKLPKDQPMVRPPKVTDRTKQPTVLVSDSVEPLPAPEPAVTAPATAMPVVVAPVPTPRAPRAPSEHGSHAMYQRGCRVEADCPSFIAGGISCPQARRDYQAELKARKAAESAAARAADAAPEPVAAMPDATEVAPDVLASVKAVVAELIVERDAARTERDREAAKVVALALELDVVRDQLTIASRSRAEKIARIQELQDDVARLARTTVELREQLDRSAATMGDLMAAPTAELMPVEFVDGSSRFRVTVDVDEHGTTNVQVISGARQSA